MKKTAFIVLIVIALAGCTLFRPVVVTQDRVPSNWSDKAYVPHYQGDYSRIPVDCEGYVKDYLNLLYQVDISNIELEKIKGLSSK